VADQQREPTCSYLQPDNDGALELHWWCQPTDRLQRNRNGSAPDLLYTIQFLLTPYFIDQDAYQLSGLAYSVYGFEYKPGFDNAVRLLFGFLISLFTSLFILPQYITWISDNKATWTLTSDAIGADARTEIAARGVSQEPMVGFNRPLLLTYN
jgi:hypothetical protein